MMTSSQVALQVIQQAIFELAKWAEVDLPKECQRPDDNDAIAKAKKILGWEKAEIKPLRLLFDHVQLSPEQEQTEEHHYLPATRIGNKYVRIPYPKEEKPDEQQQDDLRSRVSRTLNRLGKEDWENPSLLMLILEKFGSCLSFAESNDIALVDMARATAALADALVKTQSEQLCLIAGDLSGIQKFIYTISSDGALKSLRARSFYLELVTEEIVQQLLERLKLPRTSVIYAGGGNLYLLAASTDDTRDRVRNVRQQMNEWLLKEFQGKVFLALYCFPSEPEDKDKVFAAEDLVTEKFAEYWEEVTRRLAKQKSRKFADHLTEFIEPRDAHTPCKVCHRDDLKEEELQPLKEGSTVFACPTCRNMFELGDELFRVKSIVRSRDAKLADEVPNLTFNIPSTSKLNAVDIYYYLSKSWKPIIQNTETVFLVNDWTVEHYKFRHLRNPVPLLLGNYGQRSQEESGFIRAGEMAKVAKGINRVGYLRMDVDNLGKIFARGLGERRTFPRLAGLSRQMSYFFKVYLNSLAEKRFDNLPKLPEYIKTLSEKSRPNLLFIYAGGDDLFVSGAWNEVVEFGFDVYQCFRAYTGNNPDVTLSGGISITDIKFPLYQAAREAEESEKAAKSNGRDSLGLFGEKFKWSEWLGRKDIEVSEIKTFDSEIKEYLGTGCKLELFGILPFIQALEDSEIGYSRSFVRNLLDTANLQNQKIKEINQKIKEIEDERQQEEYTNQKKDIRYYLHLPQIAYTLARLPKDIRENPKFKPVRTSLKSPYNAPYFRAIATWIELLNRSSNS